MPIKVRVGQTEAVKILASAGGGSLSAVNSKNVIGGIASVTQLDVSGISTLGNVNAGVITGTSFTGDLIGNVTGGEINADRLKISGLSTFTGIVTTVSDLYVGRNLFIKNDVTFDEFNARNLNITGISTFGEFVGINSDLHVTGVATFKDDVSFDKNVSIGGTLTYEDVTNVDSVGLVTAGRGFRATTGGLIVTAGVSTFNDDLVLKGQNTNARWNYATSDLTLFDNTRLVFGDNTDFQIWHGGTHTFLKNTGGDLRIRGNKILLKTEDDGKTYIEANANQDVKLFYNNNEKLATALDGVNITGTLTAGLIDGGGF